MTNLRHELQQHVAHLGKQDVIRRMGYRSVTAACLQRLDSVLTDPDLGLASPGFDLRYTSRGFLQALCNALELPQAYYSPVIEAIEARIAADRDAYKPWLFVDTGFTRSQNPGMPLFVLASLEHRRRLPMPNHTWSLPLEEQLIEARSRVRSHMTETAGELPVWGVISRYLYCHAENATILLSTTGDVLGKGPAVPGSCASIDIDGKPLRVEGQ